MRGAFGFVVVAMAACTFGASGSGVRVDADTETGGVAATTSTDGDGPQTSAGDPGDDGGSGSGMATPMTDEGAMTDEGGSTSTTEGGQDAETTATDGAETEAGETTGPPAADNPYVPCAEGCPSGWDCHVGACGEPCDGFGTCPAGPDSTAIPVCGPQEYHPYCLLNCAGDQDGCPPGMTCQYDFEWYCGW